MSTLKDTELSTRNDQGISRTTNLQINRPYSKSSTAPSVRIHTSGLKAWSNFEVKVGIIMESTIVSCLWLDRSLYQSIILTHPSLSAMEGESSRAASKESTAEPSLRGSEERERPDRSRMSLQRTLLIRLSMSHRSSYGHLLTPTRSTSAPLSLINIWRWLVILIATTSTLVSC